jgi:hypothetical protein
MSLKTFCIWGLFKIHFILNHPALLFLITFAALTLSVWAGNAVLGKFRTKDTSSPADLGVIETATLTLLALIIGFTFSMAIARYDARHTYEEAEANAISTEFLRADLLSAQSALQVKALLNEYLDLRIAFYEEWGSEKMQQINQSTVKLQYQLWNAVTHTARETPTPILALVTAGMNDVLNSQGYTQATWLNRIPLAAWVLMMVIAVCANMLVGYGALNFNQNLGLFLIFPLIISISFFLIADIDSPTHGIIKVEPHNLQSLKTTLATHY